jgi:lysophospholipase L1-like esterase
MRRQPAAAYLCPFVVLSAIGPTASEAAGPRIMAVGDSITYGLSGTAGNYFDLPGGYRNNFHNTMTTHGLTYKAVGASTANPSSTLTAANQTRHSGYGGWTVGADVYSGIDNFVYRIDGWMQSYNPDQILLLGGINDLLLDAGVTKTTTNMDLLLGKIFTAKPSTTVFVSNLIPTTGSRAGYNSQVIAFNNALQNTLVPKYQAQGRQIHFVDQYSNFTSGGVPVGTNLPDGLHPNQAGYDLMGATFANAVATHAPNAPVRRPIVVDVGAGSPTGVNLAGTTASGPIRYNATWTGSLSELVDTHHSSSDYGFEWVSYTGVAYLSSNAAGSTTGAAAAIFPDLAARSFWGAPSGVSFTAKLTNLLPGAAYDLDFFAGHAGGTDVTRFTLTGENTLVGDLRAGGNLSDILTLAGARPSANGELVLTVTAAPGSNSLYFNAMRLTEVIAVPEPASLGTLALLGGGLLRRRRVTSTLKCRAARGRHRILASPPWPC